MYDMKKNIYFEKNIYFADLLKIVFNNVINIV